MLWPGTIIPRTICRPFVRPATKPKPRWRVWPNVNVYAPSVSDRKVGILGLAKEFIMGVTGPVPKRSEERIRRNKLDYEITKVEAAGAVEPPDLGIEDPHPIVQDLWKSMGESAQVKYFEPTDWAYARFVLHFANQQLKVSRPSGQMFQGINSALGELLVSEGARRRVRMEIERNQKDAAIVDISEMFRERLGA